MMAISIELTPDEEARLRQRASERGERPEALAGEMLRSMLAAADNVTGSKLLPVVDEAGIFHQDRWERVLASIEAGSQSAPALAEEALTREALYSDHD